MGSQQEDIDALTRLIVSRNVEFVRYYPRHPALSSVLANASGGGDAPAAISVDAHIHRVHEPQAAVIASTLVRAAQSAPDLPLAFLAAGIFQESMFDPAAFNHNLFESGGVRSFGGTDWGIAQNSGYLLPHLPGMEGLSQAAMTRKACEVPWALPQYVSTMAAHYAWANGQLGPVLIAQLRALPPACLYPQTWEAASVDGELAVAHNLALWMTTAAYNAGRSGVLHVLQAGGYRDSEKKIPYTHAHSVQTWMAQFRASLEIKL